jgi:GPH family glycoside/pentoside/hexuronide:cation symporter
LTAQHGIRLMISVIPAAGSILAAFTALFYTLNEPMMKKIEQELTVRKNA